MAWGSEEKKAAEGGMKGKRTQGVSMEAQAGAEDGGWTQEMCCLQYGWRLGKRELVAHMWSTSTAGC